jgi:hypothetical protein
LNRRKSVCATTQHSIWTYNSSKRVELHDQSQFPSKEKSEKRFRSLELKKSSAQDTPVSKMGPQLKNGWEIDPDSTARQPFKKRIG